VVSFRSAFAPLSKRGDFGRLSARFNYSSKYYNTIASGARERGCIGDNSIVAKPEKSFSPMLKILSRAR